VVKLVCAGGLPRSRWQAGWAAARRAQGCHRAAHGRRGRARPAALGWMLGGFWPTGNRK
jgi:hypothetical protein